MSGKYRSNADFTPDSRLVRLGARWGGFDPEAELNQRKLALTARFQSIADDAGMPLAHLATAFVLAHPGVTSVIIGPRTFDQLIDSLAAAAVSLDAATLDAIDEAWPAGADINSADPSTLPVSLRPASRRRT